MQLTQKTKTQKVVTKKQLDSIITEKVKNNPTLVDALFDIAIAQWKKQDKGKYLKVDRYMETKLIKNMQLTPKALAELYIYNKDIPYIKLPLYTQIARKIKKRLIMSKKCTKVLKCYTKHWATTK
mgnify:FL=1